MKEGGWGSRAMVTALGEEFILSCQDDGRLRMYVFLCLGRNLV